jgi:hypothetical protein
MADHGSALFDSVADTNNRAASGEYDLIDLFTLTPAYTL